MNKEIKFRFYSPKSKVMFSWEDMLVVDGGNKLSVLENDDYIKMQFTGLKDKNGKEIYEGDYIVQEHWNGGDNIIDPSERDEFEGVVVWDVNGFGIQTKICDKNGIEVDLFENDEFITSEVIGNLYENPELLTQNKDE